VRIEQTFGCSPVANALRFVELTSERCAVVYCERCEVKWAKRSPTFAWRKKGMGLSPDSIVRLFQRGAIEDVAQPVPADAWISGLDPDVASVDIIEHVQVIPEPGWGACSRLCGSRSVQPTVYLTRRRSEETTTEHRRGDSDSLDLTDDWSSSSLGSPVNGTPIEGELSWSAFQRRSRGRRRPLDSPHRPIESFQRVAFEPRGDRPDMIVREAAIKIVAVLEAKDRARLTKTGRHSGNRKVRARTKHGPSHLCAVSMRRRTGRTSSC